MVIFIDMTDKIEGYQGPHCAFLSTSSDTFIVNTDGKHLWSQLDADFPEDFPQRLRTLVPEGFFKWPL